MRYLAECPRCHTRLGRAACLRWVIDGTCGGCHERLRANSRYILAWSAVVFGPGGVLVGLAIPENGPWQLPASVLLGSFVLGYLLLPYVLKLELADDHAGHR
jgi:hypothetical protein